jgi:hypothetical protein
MAVNRVTEGIRAQDAREKRQEKRHKRENARKKL